MHLCVCMRVREKEREIQNIINFIEDVPLLHSTYTNIQEVQTIFGSRKQINKYN